MGHFGPGILATAQQSGSSDGVPRGYRDGLTLSHNSTDSDHDIDIAAGIARDSGNDYDLELTSGLTKQIDSTWVVGDDAGGLFSGTVSNDTWYHVFLIRKDSDGSIDAGFDTDVDAANIPSGYTAYRRLGSVLTDGSSNIKAFLQDGNVFTWRDDQVADVDDSTPPTSWTAGTLTVPTGLIVRAIFSLEFAVTDATRHAHFGHGDQPDPTGKPVRFILRDPTTGSTHSQFSPVTILRTNTSAQIKYKVNSSG